MLQGNIFVDIKPNSLYELLYQAINAHNNQTPKPAVYIHPFKKDSITVEELLLLAKAYPLLSSLIFDQLKKYSQNAVNLPLQQHTSIEFDKLSAFKPLTRGEENALLYRLATNDKYIAIQTFRQKELWKRIQGIRGFRKPNNPNEQLMFKVFDFVEKTGLRDAMNAETYTQLYNFIAVSNLTVRNDRVQLLSSTQKLLDADNEASRVASINNITAILHRIKPAWGTYLLASWLKDELIAPNYFARKYDDYLVCDFLETIIDRLKTSQLNAKQTETVIPSNTPVEQIKKRIEDIFTEAPAPQGGLFADIKPDLLAGVLFKAINIYNNQEPKPEISIQPFKKNSLTFDELLLLAKVHYPLQRLIFECLIRKHSQNIADLPLQKRVSIEFDKLSAFKPLTREEESALLYELAAADKYLAINVFQKRELWERIQSINGFCKPDNPEGRLIFKVFSFIERSGSRNAIKAEMYTHLYNFITATNKITTNNKRIKLLNSVKKLPDAVDEEDRLASVNDITTIVDKMKPTWGAYLLASWLKYGFIAPNYFARKHNDYLVCCFLETVVNRLKDTPLNAKQARCKKPSSITINRNSIAKKVLSLMPLESSSSDNDSEKDINSPTVTPSDSLPVLFSDKCLEEERQEKQQIKRSRSLPTLTSSYKENQRFSVFAPQLEQKKTAYNSDEDEATDRLDLDRADNQESLI